MSDRPILFSGPMVRAILEGRKTQTRRIMPHHDAIARHASAFRPIVTDCAVFNYAGDEEISRAAYAVNDRLWVREAWRCNGWASDAATIFYRASECDGYTAMCEQYPVTGKARQKVTGTWRPSIHMPRWASRLTLIVTDVRVQRLQEISEEDALAEGCPIDADASATASRPVAMDGHLLLAPTRWFSRLWDSLYGSQPGQSWADNPWVVAVSFETHRCNIDALASKDAAE